MLMMSWEHAESKLHRHNQLFDLDGKKVSIFEKTYTILV